MLDKSSILQTWWRERWKKVLGSRTAELSNILFYFRDDFLPFVSSSIEKLLHKRIQACHKPSLQK
jgi:hypothetical protein